MRMETAFNKPPFRISEEGWGEFDMQIEFTADKAHFIQHDLNFAQERYESKHVLVSILKLCILVLCVLRVGLTWLFSLPLDL